MIDVYGNHRVISIDTTGNVMRVLVEDIVTRAKEYRVISLTDTSA